MDFLLNLSNHIDLSIIGVATAVIILSFVPKIDLIFLFSFDSLER
jgi:hypothetical protein